MYARSTGGELRSSGCRARAVLRFPARSFMRHREISRDHHYGGRGEAGFASINARSAFDIALIHFLRALFNRQTAPLSRESWADRIRRFRGISRVKSFSVSVVRNKCFLLGWIQSQGGIASITSDEEEEERSGENPVAPTIDREAAVK